MNEDNQLEMVRCMAFERAKGELYSIIYAYKADDFRDEEMNSLIDNFVSEAQSLIDKPF